MCCCWKWLEAVIPIIYRAHFIIKKLKSASQLQKRYKNIEHVQRSGKTKIPTMPTRSHQRCEQAWEKKGCELSFKYRYSFYRSQLIRESISKGRSTVTRSTSLLLALLLWTNSHCLETLEVSERVRNILGSWTKRRLTRRWEDFNSLLSGRLI